MHCHYTGWCIGKYTEVTVLYSEVSFIQRCPLFKVSFIRDSIVLAVYCDDNFFLGLSVTSVSS